MTTFDTTGMGGRPPEPAPPAHDGSGLFDTHSARPPAPADSGGIDALSLLRQTVADQVEIEPVTITVPRVGVRLVCHTDITARQMAKWQENALPAALRNSPKATVLHMDQFRLAVAVLVNTNLRIEVADPQHAGEWLPVEDARDGRPLTLGDRPVLDLFNAIDTASALKKLFGREGEAIRASREVVRKAGFGDDEMIDPDAEEMGLDPR